MLTKPSLVLARQATARTDRIKAVLLLVFIEQWFSDLHIAVPCSLLEVDTVLPEVVEVIRSGVKHHLTSEFSRLISQVGPNVISSEVAATLVTNRQIMRRTVLDRECHTAHVTAAPNSWSEFVQIIVTAFNVDADALGIGPQGK